MADSINLDIGYFDHIKTVRLAGLLGRGAEMLPVRLWCYCGMHPRDNGTLTDFSADDVEAVILKWWGKRGQAVEAMLKTGFLEIQGETFVVSGWSKRNGHIVAFHERASNAAKARWEKARASKCASNAPSNAPSIAKQCPTDLPTDLPTNPINKGLKRSDRTVCEVDSGGSGGGNCNGKDVAQNLQTQDILDRLAEFTGSDGNRAFYQKAVVAIGAGLVEEAVAEVRMRHAAGVVHDKERYLVRVLTDWMEARGAKSTN